MNNVKSNDEQANDTAHEQDADLTRLLTEAGINSEGLFLSNERIEEIAATDADDEKRQLASRLLNMQKYAQGLSYLRILKGKGVQGDNIFNPFA